MQNDQKKNETACYFCVNNMDEIDYKNTKVLQKFINIYKKILPKRRTGTCSLHQRKLSIAIKRARTMALLPYLRR